MTPSTRIAFLGTSRSGLGHLRRLTTIAHQLRRMRPEIRPLLITNAPPAGLPESDLAVFRRLVLCERAAMAAALVANAVDVAVPDTMHLPGLDAFGGRAALILRETPAARLPCFARSDGKPWDRVIVPNPVAHWVPDLDTGFARAIDAVGWIVRQTGPRRPDDLPQGLVVATGGGGTADSRARLYPLIDRVIAEARRRARRPVRVRQALGPRADGVAIAEADEVFDPAGSLNEVFRAADLVISTSGYNSVLELATTDTPVLLAAIPRGLDDQAGRARLWGPRLGLALDPSDPGAAAAWLADLIDRPRRRSPVELGPDGAPQAARQILELSCRAS